MAVPKQPQLPLFPLLKITKNKYNEKKMSEPIVNFAVIFFIYNPKINKKPIKNSRPIINRAINGANFQPPIPKSTKVNSNGSIGYSFV